MSEYTLFEETKDYPNGRITIKILPDNDLDSPDEYGDCEPTFYLANNGQQLHYALELEFVIPEAAYDTLADGEVYDPGNGDWYYGVTKYEHTGIALAFCKSIRALRWPDQQWDVVPLVGWVKITKKLREEWGIGDDAALAKRNAECCLKEWEAYLNGEGYGYAVTVTDNEGNEIDGDSCFGYYDMYAAKSDAEAMARDMLHELKGAGL